MPKCISPYYVEMKDQTSEKFPVRCGKCHACLSARTAGWSFRLIKEGEVSESALFVTLTYNTANVPISPKGFMTLRLSDIQKFFKRLRKNSGKKIRYYICGEYGGEKMRPHYHIILFNCLPDDVNKAWSYEKDGKRLAIGDVHFGDVSGASIGYTLKYMQKEKKIPLHANDDRKKEFATFSKGLGANYLTNAMIQWHKRDLTRTYVFHEGKKLPMPRYYKEKIYSEKERQIIGEYFKELEENKPELSPEEMHIKMEFDKISQQRMFKNALKGRKNEL